MKYLRLYCLFVNSESNLDDITKKKIPADILAKIGQPTRIKGEGIPKVKYDLTPYGIQPDE